MTATLERPLRDRALLRARIYGLTTRANQLPAYHPLRLKLEGELADRKTQLTEVEQCIGAFRRAHSPKPAPATEAVAIRDLPYAARPASVAQGAAGYARGGESWLGLAANEKHETGDADQVASPASIAPRYRLVVIRSLHRAGVWTAHAAAGSSSFVRRMLEAIGENFVQFWIIGRRALARFAGHARRTFHHFGIVATRNCGHAVGQTHQGIANGSRLLRQSIEALLASGKEFLAFASGTLSRFPDRIEALRSSCRVAAANLRRLAGAVIEQCTTASVSVLHQSTQMVVAGNMKLWRTARQTFVRTSGRIGAVLGKLRVATEHKMRRACADVIQGFAAIQRFLFQAVVQPASRWAGFLLGIVASRIADGVGAATGAGRRAAERAAVQAKRGVVAGRLLLQKVMIAARIKGGEIWTLCRRFTARISDRARTALAVCRPAAILALQNARAATLRRVAWSQQIAREKVRTARARWGELSGNIAVARAAGERWAAPKLQRADVQAKRSVVAGRLVLQKVMRFARIKRGEIWMLCRRLAVRVSDRARKALAISRPAAILALNNAQSATLRRVAWSQQIARESVRTALARSAELSCRIAVARTAVERWAEPKLHRADVQAKRSVVAGRLVLQKAMIAARVKGGEVWTFCQRLAVRIFDRIKKSTRRPVATRV